MNKKHIKALLDSFEADMRDYGGGDFCFDKEDLFLLISALHALNLQQQKEHTVTVDGVVYVREDSKARVDVES